MADDDDTVSFEDYDDRLTASGRGIQSVVAEAGFTEVSRPTLRRAVMRIDF